jgi:dolichyl-phosphate-mannose-protein mannosyltransferase
MVRVRQLIASLPTRVLYLLGLGVVLISAATLRMMRVWWGLPYPVHWDEPFVINAALRIVSTGDWKPAPTTYVYGTLPIYIDALASGLAYVLDAGRGLVQTPAQYAVPSPFSTYSEAFALTTAAPGAYVASRIVSVLFGVGTVATVYVVGRRLNLRAASLFGAALLAVGPLPIDNTSIATVDGPATFFMMVSVVMAVIIVESGGRTGHYVVCGAACGLATACKSNVAIAAVLLPLAYILGPPDKRALRQLAIGVAAIPTAFLLVEPYALLDYSNFLGGLGYNAYHYGYAGHEGANIQRGLPAVMAYLNEVGQMLGGLGSGLAVVGVGSLAVRKARASTLLLGLAVVYLLVMSRLKVFFPRNAMPLLPLSAVWTAAGLRAVSDLVYATVRRFRSIRVGRFDVPVPLAVGIALLFLVALTLGPTLANEADISRRMLTDSDSRERAVDWLHSHGGAGTSVAFDHDLPVHFPSVVHAGLNPVRLDSANDNCSIGNIAVRFVVSPHQRNCSSRLKLVAEFPGREVAQEPLFNPALYVYQTSLDDGTWSVLKLLSVDDSNQSFFSEEFLARNGYRQFARNGAASFGPIRPAEDHVEVRISAAATFVNGREAVMKVELQNTANNTQPDRRSLSLPTQRTDYRLDFVVRAGDQYNVRLIYDDDFYADGKGDRNVDLYNVSAKDADVTAGSR